MLFVVKNKDILILNLENHTKRSKRSRISGPYIPYGLFQTKGETCAKFGSDRFRNVDLYKVQTNIQTNVHLYIYDLFKPTTCFGLYF